MSDTDLKALDNGIPRDYLTLRPPITTVVPYVNRLDPTGGAYGGEKVTLGV